MNSDQPRDTLISVGGPDSPIGPAKLVVTSGPDEGKEMPLTGTIRVGSARDNDLALNDPCVSRKHAVFLILSNSVVVRDLDSRNGTLVDGARVKEAALSFGTTLRLGPDTVITVQPLWHVREVTPSSSQAFGDLLGKSVAMREIFAMLDRVSPTDVAVLIEGETGTGKEVTARAIVEASARRDKPYVVFDCGAVPHDLAESELFGHKQGAFSGAVSDRTGAFARADGGTILLDEIGELPLDLQPKLLRALEAGEFRSVGEDRVRKVDVRVMAATNRDLHAEVRRGSFREDLLYRLDVVRIHLPPLRHRPEDIPLMVEKLLGDAVDTLTPLEGPNLEKLLGYAWPGNVRELRNTLQRAAALASDLLMAGRVLPTWCLIWAQRPPQKRRTHFPGSKAPWPTRSPRNRFYWRLTRLMSNPSWNGIRAT